MSVTNIQTKADRLFQSEPISKPLNWLSRRSTRSVANRDFLPILCFSINKTQRDDYFFDVKILFNDYYRIARSTLVETAYKLTIYRLSQKNKSQGLNVDSTLVVELGRLISPTDMVELDKLKPGVYLIEVYDPKP